MTKGTTPKQGPRISAPAPVQPRPTPATKKLAKLEERLAAEIEKLKLLRRRPRAGTTPSTLAALEKRIAKLKVGRRNLAGGLGRARSRALANYARDRAIAAEYNARGSHSGRSEEIAKREGLSQRHVTQIARTFKRSEAGEQLIVAARQAEVPVDRNPDNVVRARELIAAIPHMERMLGRSPTPRLADDVRRWNHWKIQMIAVELDRVLKLIYRI